MTPTTFVLFGITGDLATHKVLPALYGLVRAGHLPESFRIIGVSRQQITSQQITDLLQQTLAAEGQTADQNTIAKLTNMLTTVQMNPVDPQDYHALTEHIGDSRVFMYLSLPPQTYEMVIESLAANGLTDVSLLVEKPFGFDLASGQELIAKTAQHFSEEQMYRIDHYLAKTMVQNMLNYRAQLETDWNGSDIAQIDIIATESIGIAGRANFYDNIGALRDVIQSHLLQFLAVSLIDEPGNHQATAFHNHKLAVLQQLQAATAEQAKRGQYSGYRQEVSSPNSNTETYAQIQTTSNNPRWKDTNFVLTTGKSLAQKYTGIIVTFRDGSKLEFCIQPDHKIVATTPEGEQTVTPYSENTEAYERVLLDAFTGDKRLFVSDQEVLESWRIVQPVIDAWSADSEGLVQYEQGAEAL